MYRTIADFTQDFAYERGMTRKLFDNLTPASLAQPVSPGGRTLGEQYSATAERLNDAIAAQWTDAGLAEEVPMYGGEMWKRSQVLNALVKHEVHHRAQMTVLMRQASLLVPGIYGPAAEEWEAMGLPPHP